MQMIIGQVAAVQNGQAAGGKTPVTGTASKGFGSLLVQTAAGGEAAAAAAANAGLLQNALLASLLGGGLVTLFAGGSAAEMDAKLTDLVNQLQNGSAQGDEEQTSAALQDLLKQFDNLIASILGGTALQEAFRQTDVQPESEGAAQPADTTGALAAVKVNLQSVLTQLQTLIRQGGTEVLSKEQLAEAGKLIAKLGGVLQGQTGTGRTQTDMDGLATDSVQNAQSGSVVHLQRMSRQSQHTGYFASQTPEQTAAAAVEEPEAQPAQQVWLSALQQAADSNGKAAEGAKPVLPQVNIRQFSEAMTGMIVKQFGISQTNGLSEARITLLPEHLGQVDVRIAIQNGQLTAHFVTDNPAAKDLLENQFAQLRSALQSQGLQVDKLQVTQDQNLNQSQIQSQLFQEQRRQGSGAFQQPKTSRSKEQSVDDVLQEFERQLVEQTAVNGLGYGRAINITA